MDANSKNSPGEDSSSFEDQNNRVLHHLRAGPDCEQRQLVINQGESYGEVAQNTVISDRPIRVSRDLSSEQFDLVGHLIQETNPIIKHCFRNSLEGVTAYPGFNYVEGFAIMDDVEIAFEHALLSLNDKLVDMTTDGFNSYYGIEFSDREILKQYYNIGLEADSWGILGDHQRRYEDNL